MSATKKQCTELIRLCSGLDFFPADPAVRDLLASTLQRYAVSAQHAARIVEHWLETERRAPAVADLVRLSREVNPTPVQPVRPINYDCPECEGGGYQIVRLGVLEITGAARCPNGCPIGGSDAQQNKLTQRAVLDMYHREEQLIPTRRAAVQAARRRPVVTPQLTEKVLKALRENQDARRTYPRPND